MQNIPFFLNLKSYSIYLYLCKFVSGSGRQSDEVNTLLCKVRLSSYDGSLNTNACLPEGLLTNNVFEKIYKRPRNKRQITLLSN